MKVTRKTKYGEFLILIEHSCSDIEEGLKRIEKFNLSDLFSVNFEDLTFGKLRELQEQIRTTKDIFHKPFEILLNIPPEEYKEMKAVDCIRFVLHVKSSLEEITKLFDSIQSKPTEEEIKAGINKLSGGFFATADWYARRMGITNHDDVDNVKWGIIYLAKKKDSEEYQFQERYRKVIEQKHKRNGKG